MIDPVASTTAASAATTTSGASKTDDVSKGFEKLLLQQLSQEMLKTVSAWNDDSEDSDGGSSEALGGAYASMLPDALTNAVESAGGLGLDLGLGKASS
jgi:Rod binding domain-containing protein